MADEDAGAAVPAPTANKWNLSYWVAGQEKFLTMVLGAVAVYVQATTRIQDQDMKNLVCALIVAAQGWLATNSGSVLLEPGEVVAQKTDVDPAATTKPPSRILPNVSDK